MFGKYRFISARKLLDLESLAKCQSFPEETWAHGHALCHIVFVSHRWEAEEQEFRDVLNQGIVEMAASPHASTLMLRWNEDGYLNRGW